MTFRRAFLALLLAVLAAPSPARPGEGNDWRPALTVRFGNIDAIDADDGDVADFLRRVRNDGRFPPPVRTLVGPAIRNPTLFGLVHEGWLECVVLAPVRPGPLAVVWVFPIDNRDEYMAQLAGQGLSEYEGMDGTAVLREMDLEGNAREWHMDWLPGDIAVFGAARPAVTAARGFYTENRAARGVLAGVDGTFVEADVSLRFDPSRLAAWQPAEAGSYWWRDAVRAVVSDLVGYWRPSQARVRFMDSLAEALVSWPRLLERVDASFWFERQGVEFRLAAHGDFRPAPPPSDLGVLRRLPERTAAAAAFPVTPGSFTDYGEYVGRLILASAGGVTTAEARAEAARVFSALELASPRQALGAWVAPPPGHPELGAVRLLLVEWAEPSYLRPAWNALLEALKPDAPATQVLAQLGWTVALRPDDADPMRADLVISPPGGGAPYLDASLAVRLEGRWLALASGRNRRGEGSGADLAGYRAEIARVAAGGAGEGIPAVRDAFTRMGPDGAAFLAFLDPVRFLQIVLAEVADWRPRMPDQPESASVRLAREMLEYDSGGAWSVVGESAAADWRFIGGMSWESLGRLSAALGITEAIGMNE